jgi:hypothetical protein
MGEKAVLENASEEARAGAQQTAEDAAETEGSAADGRAVEATLSADVRFRQHVADRADDLQRAVTGLPGQTADHVTELVVAGENAALVTEDSAFTVEQPACETAEQSSIEQSQEAADCRHLYGDCRSG